MSNTFTNYGFALIQTQQLQDKKSAEVFYDIFIGFGTNSIKAQLDFAIEKKLAKPFDTQTAALIIIQGVMMAINAKIQKELGTVVPFDATEALEGIKQFIIKQG
jgi:uridine kinase